ncbi:MAG: hypothetical protein AAF810_01305 [Cyanobacteria bacterium P01_D01_bin.36]
MSATAFRNFSTRSALTAHYDLADAQQDIQDFLNGCYELNYWELTQEEADEISQNPRQAHEKLMDRLSARGKSAGAKYIAARINSGAAPDIAQLAKDWWSHRAIKQGMRGFENPECTAADLRYLGIKTEWQTRRFLELYQHVEVKDRVWGSSLQVDHSKVLAIATTPNFNRLPLWVKKGLIEHAPYINTDRVGNIWRLPDCVRAWKWCSALPKGIAEKVGRMSVKGRVIAALAWRSLTLWNWRQREWKEYSHLDEHTSRQAIVADFWQQFRQIERGGLVSALSDILYHWQYESGTIRCIIEGWLGLPFKSLVDEWDNPTEDQILELIAVYGDPKDACKHLFGCNGKGTVKAFQSCNSKTNWRWASTLANGNPDAVQKILSMNSLIDFQSDAVAFLMSLPMVSRLRMLQATEFKYRGKVQPISSDHVRDTGYLWSNITVKPELGRVRCWFSVHKTLAAAFVKELPDEALPIPGDYSRVDGLSAIDGSWEIEFPQRVATLKYYGQALRNCVGGYGPAIKSGRSVIFAVREYGQLTHCVELDSDGYCRQFYQAGNLSADRKVQGDVIAALQQAGLAQ